jgi:TonB family protein
VAPDVVVGSSPESAQPLTVEAVPDRSGEAPAAPETQPGSTAVEAAPVTAADAPPASPARSPSQPDSVAEAPSAPSTGVAAVEEAAQAPPSGPSMELEAVQPAAEAGVDADTAATRQPEAELQPTTAPRTVEATAPQTVKLQELQQRSGGAGVVAHYAGVLKGWLQRNMHYPRAARLAGQEGDVVVRFVIDREGNVQSVELETGSGYPLLDREATEMVERGDPFPAMPDDMPGDRLEVRVPVSFHVRDETLNKNLPPIDLE